MSAERPAVAGGASAEMGSSGSPWLAGAALAMLALVAYGPAYVAGFVWDDDANVTANLVLRDAAGLRDIWLRPGVTTQYYPLVYTSFWLEYAAWGLDPLGYHADNVLLHAGSALLLWRLGVALDLRGAWLAAALFAVHPVHVESVAWVTERKNVLSGFFYLASALFYVRSASGLCGPSPGRFSGRGYAMSLVLYAAALLSKPPTATLPAALLLVVWWKQGRIPLSQVARVAPMVAIAVPIGWLTVGMEQTVGDHLVFDWSPALAERVLLLGRALWFYAGKLAAPFSLTFVYPRWNLDPADAAQWAFPLAAVVVVAVLYAGRARFGRGPLAAVLYFAGTLVPALGFIEIYFFKFSYVADHWQYLASIGLLALAAAGLTGLARGWGGPTRSLLAGLLLLALGTLTWQQARIYHDIETLWRDTLRKNPEAVLAHYNLAHHLHSTGRDAEAEDAYRTVLRLDPDYAEAHNNLGYLLFERGQATAAIARFRRAIELAPDSMRAHWNLAGALASEGKREASFRHYERGLRFQPRTEAELQQLAAGHDNLGVIYGNAGRLTPAIRHFRRALALDPGLSAARRHLGLALLRAGRPTEAVPHLERALAIEPADATVRRALRSARRQALASPEP